MQVSVSVTPHSGQWAVEVAWGPEDARTVNDSMRPASALPRGSAGSRRNFLARDPIMPPSAETET